VATVQKEEDDVAYTTMCLPLTDQSVSSADAQRLGRDRPVAGLRIDGLNCIFLTPINSSSDLHHQRDSQRPPGDQGVNEFLVDSEVIENFSDPFSEKLEDVRGEFIVKITESRF
jgi:hypothetical protein